MIFLAEYPDIVASQTPMSQAFHAYCYISEAKPELSGGEFKSLIESARTFNKSHGIHGVLFFDGHYFIQYIEGHTESLQLAVQRIQQSSLHQNLATVVDCDVAALHFKVWDLRFNELESSRTLMDQLHDAEGDIQRIGILFDHTLTHLQHPHAPANAASQTLTT